MAMDSLNVSKHLLKEAIRDARWIFGALRAFLWFGDNLIILSILYNYEYMSDLSGALSLIS